jgi:lysophospholipase L1-like esterase
VAPLKGILAATSVAAVLLAAEAEPALAHGKVFHVNYSGTVTETSQPYGRQGNSYSESITFSLTRNGTLEQLARGSGSDELSASGQLSADMANKPPEIPPSSCSEKVSVGGSVPAAEILAVSRDGSAGAQLNALLADLTPQAAGRSDFCWVDSDFQWLKDGADPGSGFSEATLPRTGTELGPGASRSFDYTGSTSPSSAHVVIKTRISAAGAYIALGDSYSSGEGAGDYYADTLAPKGDGCDRSLNAYPQLLARDLGYPLEGFVSKDASFAACSGAKTSAIDGSFKGEVPQIDHVHKDDSLITISIGGNDVGFAPVLKYCLKHADCSAHERPIVIRDLEAVRRAIPPVLEALRNRAPAARIVVVGYPNFMPSSGDCHPAGGLLHWLLHMTSANVEFIHTGIAALNRDTEHIVQGRPNMAYVLPNESVWRHHTICGHSPWFVRVDLTHALSHSAVFFHPTAEGQRELEREVLPAAR